MTGWGRTGTLFACEQARVTPDIACYSKGLTGGSLPLAVTLCRADIFDAHYSTDRSRTFFHSSSYTANPIACAAALANLEIWEKEPVLERVAAIARLHAKGLDRFRDDRRFSQCPPDRLDRRIGPRIERDRLSGRDRTSPLSGLPVTSSAGPAARQHDLSDAALLQRGKRTRPGLWRARRYCRRLPLKANIPGQSLPLHSSAGPFPAVRHGLVKAPRIC